MRMSPFNQWSRLLLVAKEKLDIFLGRQTPSGIIKADFNYPNLQSQVKGGWVKNMSLDSQKVGVENKAPNTDATCWKQASLPPPGNGQREEILGAEAVTNGNDK
jgi:hypothetical protein